MSKREIEKKRVLITGASSGIGRALALELARAGARVAIMARRLERLEEVASQILEMGGEVITIAGDVTDEAVRTRALQRMVESFGGLDILINNAGIGAMGLFENAQTDRLRRVMEVNFIAPVELIRQSLPLLRGGDDPLIVNISSIIGKRAIPHAAEYSASKFAVEGFSESLRVELMQHGIGVLVVCPGTTETEFFEQVIDNSSEPNWPSHRPIPAEKVALRIVTAIRRRRRELIPYFTGKVVRLLSTLAPSLMDRIIRKYV